MTETAQTWRGALGRAKTLEFQEYALAIVVVLLFIAGAILKPDTFPTWDNIRNMLTQSSVVGVLAIGMTFVIATAGIDLSVGSMVAAAGVFGGIMVGTDGTSSLVFILAAIAFATFLGTINATAVAYGRVVPFIATLAMFSVARGLALLLNDQLPVSLLDLNGGSFGDPRGLPVAADGDDVSAVARPVEDDPTEDRDGQKDEHRDRDPEDPSDAEPQQRERPRVPERAPVQVEQADRQLVVQ